MRSFGGFTVTVNIYLNKGDIPTKLVLPVNGTLVTVNATDPTTAKTTKVEAKYIGPNELEFKVTFAATDAAQSTAKNYASALMVKVDEPRTTATPDSSATLYENMSSYAEVLMQPGANNHTASWSGALTPSGKFAADGSYTVEIYVSGKNGADLELDIAKTDFFINDHLLSAAAGANQNYVSVSNTSGLVGFKLTYTFPSTEKIKLEQVFLTVAPPENKNLPTAPTSNTTGITVDSYKWYKVATPDVEMVGGARFEADSTYKIVPELALDNGYQITAATRIYINGVDVTGTKPVDYNYENAGNLTVSRSFATAPEGSSNEIKSAAVSVTSPATGKTPDNLATIKTNTKDNRFTVTNASWSPTDSTFKETTQYTITTTVKPNGDYYFSENTVFTVGGHTPTPVTPNKDGSYTLVYKFPATTAQEITGDGGGGGGGGGGGTAEAVPIVLYWVSDKGTTNDLTAESVAKGSKPGKVPAVKGVGQYRFKGWSLDNPEKVKEPKLVDPKTVKIEEDTTFYAVYTMGDHVIADHTAFIKGYPDGNFGPADNITRGSVAMIIARSCLEGFEEGKDYGTGGYSDVTGHWAQSAIAYCSQKGAFQGTDEGTFLPDRPITRQEFSLVFARLAGLQKSKDMPFSDIADADAWATDGVYTAYTNGWIIGYTDGTFKPKNNIARSEAVKIVDAYLNRGVNEAGVKEVLKDLKQWPDVPETYWAYYEIMEASNDHSFYFADEKNPPEVWTEIKK